MLGMKSVQARELGESLPEYLRLVESGEAFRVIDRTRVIAELKPVAAPPAQDAEVETRLASLAACGELTRAARPKKGWTWRPKGAKLPEGTAKTLLDELRAER